MNGLKQQCFYLETCLQCACIIYVQVFLERCNQGTDLVLLIIICQINFTFPPQTFNLTLKHLLKVNILSLNDPKKNTETVQQKSCELCYTVIGIQRHCGT